MAVVESALALAKVTVPVPLTLDQVVVTLAGGLGSPSSVAVPTRLAVAGRVMVWSGPAFTTGALFVGAALTVTTTSSVDESALSLAVRRSV